MDGLRIAFRIEDEEPAGAFRHPLREASITGQPQQLLDPVQRVGGAASLRRRLGPFVDQRKGKPHLRRDLFGTDFLEDVLQELVRLHAPRLLRTPAKAISEGASSD